MRITVPIGGRSFDLQIPAPIYLEARAALPGASEALRERIGLSLVCIGHPLFAGAGLGLYTDRKALGDMAGAALEWMASVTVGEEPLPVPILLAWARATVAEVSNPTLVERAPVAAPVPVPEPASVAPRYRRAPGKDDAKGD